MDVRELIRVKLDQLKDFQGRFKQTPPTELEKLKAALLAHGLITPLHAWLKLIPSKDARRQNRPTTGELLLLDGHQRVQALRALRDEGHAVPDVPVVLVRADNEAEAARKVLALASTYGTVDPEGLTEFLDLAGLDLTAAANAFSFPDINLQAMVTNNLTPKPLQPGALAVDLDALAASLLYRCPGCGFRF